MTARAEIDASLKCTTHSPDDSPSGGPSHDSICTNANRVNDEAVHTAKASSVAERTEPSANAGRGGPVSPRDSTRKCPYSMPTRPSADCKNEALMRPSY